MSTRTSTPTVALIDPLWIGHHPMYFSQFATSFLKAGARVIGLCPAPEEALRDTLADAQARGVPHAPENLTAHLLPTGGRSWFGNRFEGDPIRTFLRWKHAADALSLAEEATGHHADLIYYPYLDSYLRFLPLPGIPSLFFDRPWSGLYLRNHHYGQRQSRFIDSLKLLAKGDTLIRSKHCLEVGVLDERFNAPLEAYTGKPVVSYPDSTVTELPGHPTPLATEILREAEGRRIIGIIGLERRKGVLTLLKTALLAHQQQRPWFFVCAGVFKRALFQPDELQFIDSVLADIASGKLTNLHFRPDAPRIPTDADFNSLFTTFDVAWTAYEGFHGSSGALSKAACFDIPALATAGECIGSRVEHYRLGLNIPEGNATQAVEAIDRMLQNRDWLGNPLNPKYEEFRTLHSRNRLEQILARLLDRVR